MAMFMSLLTAIPLLCLSLVAYGEKPSIEKTQVRKNGIEKIRIVKIRPADMIRLRDIAPDIIQELRYAGSHNFVGRPLPGYQHAECWLTESAAKQLVKIQAKLKPSGHSLKVYDCTRPQRAVDEFVRWSLDASDTKTKAEFYPLINKRDVFKLGYVAKYSGHSRGSTVDLTIVRLPLETQGKYSDEQQVACHLPFTERYGDNSIDMGTGYDCFHHMSNPENKKISVVASKHRQLLRKLMLSHGFYPSKTEWWHFTLRDEPYPETYFDFDLRGE